MKPYYEESGVQIWHGDCRDILPHLPKVDLVLTDPPYNVGLKYKGFVDSMPINQYEAFSRDWFWRAFASANGNVILTPGSANLSFWSSMCPAWIYCWTTSSNTPGGRAAMRLGWEPIVAFAFPKKPMGTDVVNYAVSKQPDTGEHPCPKPIRLFSMIVGRWSDDADIVLDPFMGSGTTLRAAKDLGRKAIGIEIEERYCEIAANRLAQGVLEFVA